MDAATHMGATRRVRAHVNVGSRPHRRRQNECRIPIRTSACVCVVDGVKL